MYLSKFKNIQRLQSISRPFTVVIHVYYKTALLESKRSTYLQKKLLFQRVYTGGGGGGKDTGSGSEKRCSHNLESGHPVWWSADNYSIFPTVSILEARIEVNRQRKSEMLKNLKKIISCNFVFLAYRICLLVLKCGGN